MTRLGQLLCALRGHDHVLAFEGLRMFFRCTRCPHETPGLTPAPRPPRQTYAGDRRRHQLPRMEPLRLRRSA